MRIVLVMMAALAIAACRTVSGGEEASSEAPRLGSQDAAWLQSGAGLYMEYCASCHGVAAQGDGPVAATLRTPPSDLTRLAERYGSPLPKERLAAFVDGREPVAAHGPRDMPVWGEVLYAGDRPDSPARTAARTGTILLILEYLDTQQEAPAPPTPR